MSPRFDFDPSKVSAGGFEVLPAGDVEFLIGAPKPFARTNSKGGDSYGVRYPLKVVEVLDGDPSLAGKRLLQTCYMQSDGAQQMSKQFLMAAYGYPRTKEGEAEFNAAFAGADWSYDPDTGSVGDMWSGIANKRVSCALGIKMGKDQNQQDQEQQTTQFRPVGS